MLKGATFALSFLILLMTTAQSANIQAQEEEEGEICSVGLSILKRLIDAGTADQTAIELYNDQVRADEIKAYIDDNVDDLAIPEWMKDSDSGPCLIARDIAEQERILNTTFEGDELDENIVLQSLRVQGESAASVLGLEDD